MGSGRHRPGSHRKPVGMMPYTISGRFVLSFKGSRKRPLFCNVLFYSLFRFFRPTAPCGVDEQQERYSEEHLAYAEHGGEMTAEKGAGKHADELGRLIEPVNLSKAVRRRQLTDQAVDRRHESGDGDAMQEPQQRKLPRRSDEALRDGNEPGQQQTGGQDVLRPDAVRYMPQPGGGQHTGKAGA